MISIITKLITLIAYICKESFYIITFMLFVSIFTSQQPFQVIGVVSLILLERKAKFRARLFHGPQGASKWQSQLKEKGE